MAHMRKKAIEKLKKFGFNVRKPIDKDGHTIGSLGKKTARKFDKGKRKSLKVIGG